MRGNHRVAGPDEGTVYVIAVSGDKFVNQAQRDYIDVGMSGVSTYQTIDIDQLSHRLIYRAWTEDGAKIDEMVIAKAQELSPQKLATASRGMAEQRGSARLPASRNQQLGGVRDPSHPIESTRSSVTQALPAPNR
jgi:hypothetical protein